MEHFAKAWLRLGGRLLCLESKKTHCQKEELGWRSHRMLGNFLVIYNLYLLLKEIGRKVTKRLSIEGISCGRIAERVYVGLKEPAELKPALHT